MSRFCQKQVDDLANISKVRDCRGRVSDRLEIFRAGSSGYELVFSENSEVSQECAFFEASTAARSELPNATAVQMRCAFPFGAIILMWTLQYE